jgi:hypothetical protein
LLSVPSGTHTLRWLPPLNVSRTEVDEAVAILAGVLNALIPFSRPEDASKTHPDSTGVAAARE